MKKHAYLIIAHNEMQMLQRLVEALDDKRNDIYIHIDKKTKYFEESLITKYCHKSRIVFVPRINVRWGHYSQIECELSLLKAAADNDNYHYYHLLSGVDFPIKSQEYIHDKLENENHEFISFHNEGDGGDEFLWKIKYYYPLMRWVGRGIYEGRSRKERLLIKMRDDQWRFMEWQKRHSIDRTKKDNYVINKGAQWFSITDDCVRYVLSQRSKIRKMFRMTNAPDEFLMPVVLMNSKFKDRVINNCLRKIDWTRGTPYTFIESDYDELIMADEFFARKISYNTSPKLVEMLYEHIQKEEAKDCKNTRNDDPLISLVIPVYNVEKYLPQCLDSLISQTYSNIEIIVVNDGTKDNSRSVAEKYAEKDKRIRIIDQKNQGLSAARNTGIDNAVGEYIAFIDSDDWVDSHYVEYLYKSISINNSDVAICGFTYEYDEKTGDSICFDEEMLLSKEKAMHFLSNIFWKENVLTVIAWNKLYKKDIFDKLRYEKGVIHEDEFIAHRIIDNAKILSTVPDSLYHYRQRSDSITGQSAVVDTRHFHILKGHKDRLECCKNAMYAADFTNIVYSYFEEVKELLARYDEEFFKGEGKKLLRKNAIMVFVRYGHILPRGFRKECMQMMIQPIKYRKMMLEMRKKA